MKNQRDYTATKKRQNDGKSTNTQMFTTQKKRSKNEGREEEQEGRFAFFVNDDHILLFKR